VNMRDKAASDLGERNIAPGMDSPHARTQHAPAIAAPLPHESARAHVTGTATYIDDIPEIKGTLHAAPILSPVAHGKLRGVDVTAALAMPGVRAVVLAR
jgi:xanthine dehydrogenase large subunit